MSSYLTVPENMILSFHFSLLTQVSFVASSVKQIIEQKINYSVAQNQGTERCVLSTYDVINFVLLKVACKR
jgi:hypothetical protein